ncbi:MAG: tetratricopeptide repeat protein [Rhodospirillaceae bacterium]|nr:tetratricopeptide repeat protein [Rhodospirillaceae bacterium]
MDNPHHQIENTFHESLAHYQQGRLAQALELCRHVLTLEPAHFNALHLSGVIEAQAKHFAEAIAFMRKALEIKPDSAMANYNLGIAYEGLGQIVAAGESYTNAVRIKPDFAEAHNNRGNTLRQLRQLPAAIESYGAAIRWKPDLAAAYNNRGNAFRDMGQIDAALADYDTAIAAQSEFAEAYKNRGDALQDLKRYEAALDSYDTALEIDSGQAFLAGTRLHTKMRICDWKDFDHQRDRMAEGLTRGEKCLAPLPALHLLMSPHLQRVAAEIWTQNKHPPNFDLGPILARPRPGRIRLAYFSPDFRNHAVSSLLAGLIAHHDRKNFEIYGFSYGPNTRDAMRKRIEAACDTFIDVSESSDEDTARMARSLEIDIAIDLAGHTAAARTGALARRAAPIQVNYLGYPGTMAAAYIDYIIADHTLIPQASSSHYTEKIVRLPHSYQPNDPERLIADREFTRAELGLPHSGFVFCCFNNSFKIAPDMFDIWMRILKRIDHSVLWLLDGNAASVANLRREAAARGVNGERLIFAKEMPQADHLARHRAADIFLDTLPYNAHTTASDALWAGLPVLTCRGDAFASSVAASLLTAVEMPELITSSHEAYEALATDIASHPEKILALKQKLAKNRMCAPLFDIGLFTKHIEDAYTQMALRLYNGAPPEHITVNP